MKGGRLWCALLVLVGWVGTGDVAAEKVRLLHVDSYHREYAGSWAAIEGFNEALLNLGYLDTGLLELSIKALL